MTHDRRNRPVHRCVEADCPHLGAWPEGTYCPTHFAAAVTRLRAATQTPAETRSTEPPERRMK